MKHLALAPPTPLWLAIVSIFMMSSAVAAQPPSVTTQMYNNAHTNWNSNETTLTVANVKSSFKLLFKDSIDDATYFQPLYVPGLNIAGGTHNVVFVGTESNTVFAFDADSSGPPLWSRSLTPSGETLQNGNDYANDRIPNMGISSTGVIDTSTNTLYVVAASKTTSSPTVFHQRLHALDITTGHERSNSPVDISANSPGSGSPNDGKGNVLFNPLVEFDRAALMLFGNYIYTAWTSHEDNGLGSDGVSITGNGAYQGWVLAFNKSNLAAAPSVFNDAPNINPDPTLNNGEAGGGSIWQCTVGMVADSSSVYAVTSNGQFNANAGNYGDTLMRLTQAPSLNIADYFTPCDQQELYFNDIDLGSGAPLILPDQTSGPTQLLTFAGKEGSIYLINRAPGMMGHYTPTTSTPPDGPSTTQCTDNVVQVLWRVLDQGVSTTKVGANRDAFWSAPAFFKDSSGRQYVYYAADYSPIVEYDLANGMLTAGNGGNNQTPGTADGFNFARGGTFPTISSNGGDTSTAIVWAIRHPSPTVSSDGTGPITLEAFAANDLTQQLVTDVPAGNWTYTNDAFLIPTVANGKVYVASSGELDVFGVGGASGTPTATATATAGPTSSATPTPTPAVPGRLWLNRARINFGRVKVGSIRRTYFRVGDTGKGALQVTIPSMTSPFTIVNNPAVIALTRGKASPVIYVEFAPTGTGLAQQDLVISSTDPKRQTFTINVFGTGR